MLKEGFRLEIIKYYFCKVKENEMLKFSMAEMEVINSYTILACKYES